MQCITEGIPSILFKIKGTENDGPAGEHNDFHLQRA